MTLMDLVSFALTASLFILVLDLGLRTNVDEVTFLFRHPGQLLRSIFAMNIVMLGFALALSKLIDLDPVIKIALIALAASPVPPLLPGKQTKAGGTASYA